jgi:hypothetical protein
MSIPNPHRFYLEDQSDIWRPNSAESTRFRHFKIGSQRRNIKSENEYKEPMKKIQDMKNNSNLLETQETEETTWF